MIIPSALFGKTTSLSLQFQQLIAFIVLKIEFSGPANALKSTLKINAFYALFFKAYHRKTSLFRRLLTITTIT